jgi:hypothetical protein
MTRIRSAAGIDADGVAQTDADHWSTCSKCGERFDMRDLTQVFAHLHGAEVEITEGAGPPPRDETEQRPPQLAALLPGHAALFTHKRVISVDLASKPCPARGEISQKVGFSLALR